MERGHREVVRGCFRVLRIPLITLGGSGRGTASSWPSQHFRRKVVGANDAQKRAFAIRGSLGQDRSMWMHIMQAAFSRQKELKEGALQAAG